MIKAIARLRRLVREGATKSVEVEEAVGIVEYESTEGALSVKEDNRRGEDERTEEAIRADSEEDERTEEAMRADSEEDKRTEEAMRADSEEDQRTEEAMRADSEEDEEETVVSNDPGAIVHRNPRSSKWDYQRLLQELESAYGPSSDHAAAVAVELRQRIRQAGRHTTVLALGNIHLDQVNEHGYYNTKGQ
uniref:Uncharacterized protein n=1 Tax=Knipowitschia caucasica TaxID=637954 RepID=A0AAV2LMJ0_KNICA